MCDILVPETFKEGYSVYSSPVIKKEITKMIRCKSNLLRIMALVIFSIPIFCGVGVSANTDLVEQLPAEYDNMQGVLVAWLPLGPIPDRPITALSNDEIATLNEQSMSEEHGRGHKWGHAFNKNMAERIKLKKGEGSPSTVGLDIDVYPYHYMMLDLVKAIIDSGAVAHIVTDNASVSEQIKYFMIACGFKLHEMKKIVFHHFWLDSIWMRDYGPWITKTDNKLTVIDNKYYQFRPADNMFPEFFAASYNLIETDFDQIYSEGGNILTDEQGLGFSTEAVLFSNPGLSSEDAIALFEDLLNLDEFIFLPGSFPADIDEALAALGGTGHVDMGLKLLSDTKVMVGDFTPGSPGKDMLDNWVEWFETHTNPKGEPYEVFRVTGATNGFEPYSYVNSIIINKTIIVPQFGYTEGDAAAITAYQNAMPDYKTIGVRSELLPPMSGGLHCITKEIPLGVLKSVDDTVVGLGADEADRENHDDLVWVNDFIGDYSLYVTYPDPSVTAPAVMAATLGLPVGKDNTDNFIVPWPDLSNYNYLNPYNNLVLKNPSYSLLLDKSMGDTILRNNILFPEDPKSAIGQAVYMDPDILVVSVGTIDLAAWNGVGNTPQNAFTDIIGMLLYEIAPLQLADPNKKIVLTTPFDLGAIEIAIAQLYGQEPLPEDVEEDYYASLYADIIHQLTDYANSQGLNIAVADFTALHKDIATIAGIELQGIPLNIFTLPLLVEPATWFMTDLSAAVHAYIVINTINQHYGTAYPLPDLSSFIPPTP